MWSWHPNHKIDIRFTVMGRTIYKHEQRQGFFSEKHKGYLVELQFGC